ncbi:MAG TPA: hypothetical protein GXX18_04605 [Bacillales bacterium]|nr:hypothetical protein [Bacillales bacterium]
MEKGINNADILTYGTFNNKQLFFIQRWLELLNVNTHSKYSARYLNSHQALREVLYVCEGMLNEEIKNNDHHLKLVFDEANEIINTDGLLKEKAENYFKIISNSLKSCPKANQQSKLYSIVYQLGYVLRHLERNYLIWIVEELKSYILAQDVEDQNKCTEFEKIEALMLSLVSELLGKGWSSKRLYELIREEILRHYDADKWEGFFNAILGEKNEYVCLFQVTESISKLLKAKFNKFRLELLVGDSVLSTYTDGSLSSHISPSKTYIRVISRAYDVHSAINGAWQEITDKMDILRFYGYRMPDINKSPIVINPDGKHFTRNITVSLVSNKKKYLAPDSIIDVVWGQLNRAKGNPLNRKINSLFEFSRISEESLAPQSTFLNLWIGLESFVQTKEKDGGIENVKMVVGATSSHNYIYSLVKNFLEDCNRCNVQIIEKGNENPIYIGHIKANEAIYLLLDESKSSIIMESCDDLNTLLGYRFRQLKAILNDGRKASKVIETHKENVTRHIQRLYRIRNSIVHSAQVHYNINLFIKHLSEYVKSTMSVVLHRLESNDYDTLEQVFALVRDSVDTTIEVLKSSNNLEKEAYYNLLLKGAF